MTKSMTKGRKVLISVAAVLLAVVVGVGLLVLFFPAERIGRMVTAQAEEALDREVRIESFRVRLLPRPAVSLGGVEVSRHARPGTTSTGDAPADGFEPLLASVDRIDLRPRILPLLRGNVIIEEVVVASPALFLEIPEGGDLDLPEFEADEEPADRDAEIEIRSIVVQDGSLLYHDANTGVRVTMAGIEHRLGLDAQLTGGEMSLLGLQGRLTVASVDAELPEMFAAPLRGIRIAVDHDAELLPIEDRLDLRRLDVTVQEFPLELSGSVEALSDPAVRTVGLSARAEGIDVDRLIESLPPELLADLPTGPGGEVFTGTGGLVSLDAEVSGRAGDGEMPDVAGQFVLDEVALGYEDRNGRGNLVDGLSGRVVFSLDGAASEGVSGRLLGEPFEVSFDVRDPAAPNGTAAFRGTLDLGEAIRLGLVPEGVDAAGWIVVDLTADGRLAELEGVSVNGSLVLTAVEVVVPEIRRPLVVSDGRIELAGASASASDLRVTAGASDLALDFEVRDWLAAIAPEAPAAPAATFTLTSSFLDADELLELDPSRPTYTQLALAHLGEEPIEGRSASDHADELGLQVPDLGDVGVDGRIRIERARMTELEYARIDARVTAANGELAVPEATFNVFGGEVRMRAHLGRPVVVGADTSPVRPLDVEYTVTDVTADPFLEEFTLFRGHVGGRLLLTGAARMDLHENTLPHRERVTGEGTLAILDGELRNWPIVRALGGRLGINEMANLDELHFRDFSGRYQIAGSRILIEESVFEHSEMIARMSGSFGIAGDLDMGATVFLPGAWASRIPGAPAAFLAALTTDPDGQVPIGATLRGTTTSPEVGLDLSEAGARAADRAREAAGDAVRDQTRRLLDELGPERPSPDTADSVRDEVEAEVRDRLRRFLP